MPRGGAARLARFPVFFEGCRTPALGWRVWGARSPAGDGQEILSQHGGEGLHASRAATLGRGTLGKGIPSSGARRAQCGNFCQPGLPRRPEEVARATASYAVDRCTVLTDGGRMVVRFPGIRAGLFSGRLEYTICRGSNRIQQMLVVTTDAPSVAYKSDAGLSGLAVTGTSKMMRRSNASGQRVGHALGGSANECLVTVKTANRLIAAEIGPAGIAAFPPPHRFFWARDAIQSWL